MNPEPNTHTADGWYTITLKKLRQHGACEEAIQAVRRWKRKHHPRTPRDFEIPVTLELVSYVAHRACGVAIWTATKMRVQKKVDPIDYMSFTAERRKALRETAYLHNTSRFLMNLLQARAVREGKVGSEYLPEGYL